MDKSLIKKYIDSTFLMEEAKPKGLTATEDVQKESDKTNKDAMKAVEKTMKDYTKMDGEKENAEATKKYENSDDAQKYHNEIENLNGVEMNEYDGDVSKEFEDRAREGMGADGGSSRMGNKTGEDTANVESSWEASDDEFGDDLEKRVKNSKKERKKAAAGQEARLGVSTKSDTADTRLEEGMKRLVFKKEFNGVENALKMIPESYKVDNKTFQMTDGNENYEIRWEGSLNEGRAIILKASDKQLMNEDMQKMKHLMGYKSQETLGNLKGAERINENKSFNDIWGKTQNLLNEADYSDLDRKTVKASGKEQYKSGMKVNSQALAKELEYVAGKLSDEADKAIVKKAYNATSVGPEVEETDIYNEIRQDLPGPGESQEAGYAINGAFRRAYYLH